jgi:small-conductance mechanosensitive channel
MNSNFITYTIFAIITLALVYLVFRHLPRLIDKLFDDVSGFDRVDKTLAYFLSEALGIVLLAIVAIYVLTLLPQSALLIAMLVTIASGAFIFTSEGWLGDAMAGISLQIYTQYKVDDWVTLSNDKRGQVTRLGMFRTQLRTIQLDMISIKNSNVLASDVINHSATYLRRVTITAHTADYGEYGHDIHAYKDAIKEIAQEVQDEICPEARDLDHQVRVFFAEFGSSSDHINVVFYTYDRDDVYNMSIDAMHTVLAATLRPRGVVLGQVNANTVENTISFQPAT